MSIESKVKESISYINSKVSSNALSGIILGTGLGQLVESIDIESELAYEEIPHFVSSTVEHHAGKLIFGKLGDENVICMSGRFHFYEGYSLEEITYPIRVMAALGISNLYISNVAGGLNKSYKRGDIMIIDDHINLLGTNPLVGVNEKGDRWPDMFEPYSGELQQRAIAIAESEGIAIQKAGVYACISGPSLETRAEYRMLQNMGADAIGMSTIPEVIVAVHEKLKVFACSIITDLCYEGELKPANIGEIIETAGEAEPKLVRLFTSLISQS
jgi:purine-nucleoside phosphorylase